MFMYEFLVRKLLNETGCCPNIGTYTMATPLPIYEIGKLENRETYKNFAH